MNLLILSHSLGLVCLPDIEVYYVRHLLSVTDFADQADQGYPLLASASPTGSARGCGECYEVRAPPLSAAFLAPHAHPPHRSRAMWARSS